MGDSFSIRNEKAFEAALRALKSHATKDGVSDIRQHFVEDDQRFSHFSLRLDDLLFDFSKCGVTFKTLQLLDDLAVAADVLGRRDAMFSGQAINTTEKRSVLHIALRLPADEIFMLDGHDLIPDIQDVLEDMERFSEKVRDGRYKGSSGKRISDIVNIGIGGSDLGPAMVTYALKPYHDGPRCHFVSNADSAHISDTLSILNPETTLFVIASKTFTTAETVVNAQVARQWIFSHLGEEAIHKHFVAVSSALDKVAEFGIDPTRVFKFWSWVGGRYSIWSAIGLVVMFAIGGQNFRQFLNGALQMDQHFKTMPLHKNIPIRFALLGFWHRVICGYSTRSIIPYAQRLIHFPAYLQQLDMESNGKQVSLDGKPLNFSSGPIVWGDSGTNSQHAFFQLLHQGTDVIPVEFILFIKGHEKNLHSMYEMLLANCLAQSKALMKGRSIEDARHILIQNGVDAREADHLALHRSFKGNRPSIMLVQDLLTPFALGRLIALYEHRIFVEGILMNINSFDQWGVELGKELANELLPILRGESEADNRDSSTLGLLAHIQARRAK
ncbi:glucose-6-phosphate isomerase [Bartonella tribocorum]|uniref:Glucose-6-phosphate isomerase n=1 Tax=Bartonella tribocorum (strain DSM 28219 / CCUG 45778 / CIP 105476 / IBS 506) TaxID=382640 RepID=A9IM50_BART1|nr:glucose-6-phosphate isomerase [Bartonella tribocorum]CAK00637.1 Glucose-6-phosphate isomerase [Bartonella tribocorum CIP 105476]CDO47827.1 glucose-6-phosphate isomerase [Bartonella tribocorum]